MREGGNEERRGLTASIQLALGASQIGPTCSVLALQKRRTLHLGCGGRRKKKCIRMLIDKKLTCNRAEVTDPRDIPSASLTVTLAGCLNAESNTAECMDCRGAKHLRSAVKGLLNCPTFNFQTSNRVERGHPYYVNRPLETECPMPPFCYPQTADFPS